MATRKGANESQSFQKVSQYLFSIRDKAQFQRIVAVLREEFEIPPSGFAFKLKDKNGLPRGWVVRRQKKRMAIFEELVAALCELYGFDSANWMTCFRFFVLFDTFELRSDFEYDLIIVHPFTAKNVVQMERAYPVVLRISPYASLRDIQSYISLVYSSEIKPIQNKYLDPSIKIGKIRSQNARVRERNRFIYENQRLPRRELMRLVNDKYAPDYYVDYAYVAKIIAMENKRRKEV